MVCLLVSSTEISVFLSERIQWIADASNGAWRYGCNCMHNYDVGGSKASIITVDIRADHSIFLAFQSDRSGAVLVQDSS
jgi:hypothetical protein